MKRLVLFDIDGTLLSSNGAAPRAFRQALEEVFGTSGPLEGYSFAGRTDPQIARDLLGMAGLDPTEVEKRLPSAWKRYTDLLAREFERVTSTVYPGVMLLLERLAAASDEVILGLLTGNLADGARLKLASAGIDFDQFRVGAFGSDHADRHELPGVAVDRAHQEFGRRYDGEQIIIIGDTPKDVACGQHLGVRTIAVATGTYSADELAACEPDYLFDDFSDTDAVLKAILAPSRRG